MTHMRNAFVAAIVLLAACAPVPPKPEPAACPAQAPCPVCPVCPPVKPPPESARYIEARFDALPGWPSRGLDQSLRAFLASCPRPGPLANACTLAAAVAPQDEQAARVFFESVFAPYALVSSDGPDTGLITGYYEPVIEGSRTPDDVHRYPIFGVPDDLIVVDLAAVNPDVRGMRLRGRVEGRRLVPYYARGEIDSRGAGFAAPAIAWTADPVALFFLQIQGSGQVQLDDGERIRIGYADQNGHPYRSLGRYLVDRGELPLEQASMAGIKAWAAANPAKLEDALNSNPSYVFFRELPATNGPVGALGIPLTAEFSLAVDRRHTPLGAPVYLATTFPLSEEPLERLMAAQDTGGAIRGVVRADFFWGTGPEAGSFAGRMRQQGRMWLLWPRGEALPGSP
ncbi:MAG: transglycosylase [Betaproteobacteria bacterium]|nr:MAG: transglycosylase [Betaproteobacteria bacterium]